MRGLRERCSARNRGDDLEMGEDLSATHGWSARVRQSYDPNRDGFEQTPVYRGGAGPAASLVSFASFVEAGSAGRRGSVDTLAGMEDMVSPKTIPAPRTFVYAGVRMGAVGEPDGKTGGYVIGEDELEDAVCEGEPEGVNLEFEKGVTSPVSPVGLGISVGEGDIQAQLRMLDGKSSAEDVWSCEMVETFKGV